MSQIVQVVSMLDVIISDGETVFQSSDVNGAVCSGVLELDNNANGVSLLVTTSRVDRLIELEGLCRGASEGNDQSLKWSPDVARRSVDCFCEDGGSQSSRVTGYE